MTLLTAITLGVAAWLVVSVLLGVLIARAIRLRDRQRPDERPVEAERRAAGSGNRTG